MESLFGPIFIPKKPFLLFSLIVWLICSEPELLKPNLFIRASSSSSLKTLGLGLPNWGFGVIVPTSTKPNPRLNRGLYTSAFLSKPAATPIGEDNFFSQKVVSKIWLSIGFE